VVICDTIKPEIIANEGRIMGRIFSSADAKKLAKQYAQRKNQLQQAVRLSESMKESIRITATNLREQVAIPLLKEIPVEEINRDKKGFKIKLLEERGYKTVYDLHKASVHSISAIHGIGEETARKIKNEVAVIVKRSGANVKIRLSADNKSREATALVSALYAYRTKTDATANFSFRTPANSYKSVPLLLTELLLRTFSVEYNKSRPDRLSRHQVMPLSDIAASGSFL